MAKKMAVAIIHGMGRQDDDFDKDITKKLIKLFKKVEPTAPHDTLVIKPIWWADILETAESDLLEAAKRGGDIHLMNSRRFVIHYGGDVIAYQPLPNNRSAYDAIHQVVLDTFVALAQDAGADAPLCVIAHSLGSVVISNYFWDLQNRGDTETDSFISSEIYHAVDQSQSALVKGETFAHFYTLGSPLAIWGLRFSDGNPSSEDNPRFGKPIEFPPKQLKVPEGMKPEWINFYDKEDVIGYPLRELNKIYRKAVTEDREVNVGNWLFQSWNPFSHTGYWTSDDVIEPIAESLAKTWRQL